jgi:hypothetical protein
MVFAVSASANSHTRAKFPELRKRPGKGGFVRKNIRCPKGKNKFFNPGWTAANVGGSKIKKLAQEEANKCKFQTL